MDKVEMKENIISLELDGDKISADKLKHSINVFYSLTDEVANEVTGKKKAVDWIVSVKSGSINLISRPEPKNIDAKLIPTIVNAVGNGIDILEKSSETPPYFSEKALELAQELAAIPDIKGNGLSKICIRVNKTPHHLTLKTVASIDSLLGYHTKALGSIEGNLQAISERGTLKFTVYDALTDKGIQCNINEELRDEATKAFGKRVYVYGMIRYAHNGLPKSIRVEEIKIFPENEKLPSAFDVCGILVGA